MNEHEFTFGFRVRGGPHGVRRLVTWRKAFEAYCQSEAPTDEAYLSLWTYDVSLVEHMRGNGGVAGFSGPTWADWIPIDIDGVGADPVGDALDRTRRLLCWLESQNADLARLSCWFSGGKGFHVLLPNHDLRDARPGPRFRVDVRAFVECIGAASGCGPDPAIYDAVRIFRAPNTRHTRTGLFKVAISADDLLRISADGVRRLAAAPRPMETPEPGMWCDWEIGGMFAASEEVPTPIAREDRTALSRSTMDFIRSGATDGEREKRCFAAAANLAELDCNERLAVALLLDSALDSGLSPSEAKRAITCGIKHSARGAA